MRAAAERGVAAACCTEAAGVPARRACAPLSPAPAARLTQCCPLPRWCIFTRRRRITGFVQPADPSNLADLMPPTAPAGRSLDGRRIEPPPFLEDLEIELQPRGGGLFGGGGGGGAPADPAATLRSLQRGDK